LREDSFTACLALGPHRTDLTDDPLLILHP
jgi:hypothetical protein